jgi:hypothetical protein
MTMGRPEWGALSRAWPGEATDFTPLLAANLDVLGEAIGVELIPDAETEVSTMGGRRIDIVGQGGDDVTYVIENQYGRADHDHLTRGLAYAVAASASGLIVVAEHHRDEFRDVAHYLNDIGSRAGEGSIKVWLVEARAIRVDGGAWAPIFTAVAEPSAYVEKVAQDARRRRSMPTDELVANMSNPAVREASELFVSKCKGTTLKLRSTGTAIGVWASGPSTGGDRAIISIGLAGDLLIPFGAYAGLNSGIAIAPLDSAEFQEATSRRFDLRRTKAFGKSPEGWLTADRVEDVLVFCLEVAQAFATFQSTTEGDSE